MFKGFYLLAISLLAISTVGHAMQQTAASPPPAQKVVCKKVLETGSLVKKRKICLTSRDWDRYTEESQRLGREMQMLPATTTPS